MTGKKMQWSCLSRVTRINKEITGMMKAAGCRRVYLGLETGNPDTLRLMKKQANLEEGQNAVHLFRKAGIEVAAFFIVGYPGETIPAIEDTFRFALELPLDEISFNIPFPLPGSQLFQRISKVDTTKDWDEENEVTFVYKTEFDTHWLQRRIIETMQTFADKKKGTAD
jgi:anaerobic magnesium-protoporphyrin IX monomethyl ester cyclase